MFIDLTLWLKKMKIYQKKDIENGMQKKRKMGRLREE